MNKNTAKMMFLGAMFALSVTGCSSAGEDTVLDTVSAETAAEQTTISETSSVRETITFDIPPADEGKPAEMQEKQTADTVADLETADLFSDRDLRQEADLSNAKSLTVSDGAALTITEEGVYVLSGTAKDCTVTVNASKEDKIQLVLDGVSITNSDFPAIYVVSADKVFVTSKGNNMLSVTGTFRADGDTNTDAVIFSKDDLVLNGTGSLQITSASGNGISSKDDLKVTGGTYTIESAHHAVEANDSIAVCGGNFNIQADKDGMHCENDNAEGTIYIAGGNFSIQSGSDGIQATTILQIDGGTFDITSSEGLEATYVKINGGTINIAASDDGINASNKCGGAYPVVIEFNGGDITISMGHGDTDAVDANGSIYVNGGTIDITAPTSSFDYDLSAEFNGGTIIINGEQVSEIPQSMMGGGHGGFGGPRGDFPKGDLPRGERGDFPKGDFPKGDRGDVPQGEPDDAPQGEPGGRRGDRDGAM